MKTFIFHVMDVSPIGGGRTVTVEALSKEDALHKVYELMDDCEFLSGVIEV